MKSKLDTNYNISCKLKYQCNKVGKNYVGKFKKSNLMHCGRFSVKEKNFPAGKQLISLEY